jgi:LysM repeat protein
LFFTIPLFAEYEVIGLEFTIPAFTFVPYFAVTVPGEEEAIPHGIRNNEFFLESMRLTKLAQDTFDFGDYDASAGFAEEAIRFAQLSDEYVAFHLIGEAKRLLDWADDNNIATRFPNNYNLSKDLYETAVEAHSNEEWDEAIDSSIKSIEILAVLEAGGSPVTTVAAGTTTTTTATTTTTTTSSSSQQLPKQYTVRTWAVERDCLWNIAGYSWVYGDPWRWRTLYEANKSKLPDPDNPHLIEPGMILEIPSIRNETRQGMWTP